MGRISSLAKNETKASAHIKNMTEFPPSARLNVSLKFESHNPGYVGFIESVEAKIDSGRGYKGKREEAGRPAGTRILSTMILNDLGEEEEIFYVG
jgi:hypothetical protein